MAASYSNEHRLLSVSRPCDHAPLRCSASRSLLIFAVLYARWRRDELSIGRVGASPRVREPPHIVFNERGQMYALGLEAVKAAAHSGFPLIRLTSFQDV